jgi:signal transduction histidine kinase
MAAQTLLRRGDLAESVRESLEMISRNVQTEAHFIDDLLDLTRLWGGKSEITAQSMDLHEVVRGALQICESERASKFTPKGGEIRVSTRNEASLILVEISDTGIGIEPQALSTVFDAFTQGSADIARQFGGLGLGLAISKATIVAHGGTLHAESEGVAKGTTFILGLPL